MIKEMFIKIEDKFLSIFPGYRELKDQWEKNNAVIDKETAKKNKYKNEKDLAIEQRNDLIRRCYDAKNMIEETKLKDETKEKIMDKLRGIK